MATPLITDQGVDLVHDDGIHMAQHLAAALRGKHEVERFRGGDEDVGRSPHYRLALRGGGVAGAHHRPDVRAGVPHLPRQLRDLRQGLLKVALDVVAQRLEGRDVDDVDGVFQRRFLRLSQEPVYAGEEGGERLAGAGGSGDEGIAAGDDLRPAPLLGLGGRVEATLEPGADGGVEGVQDVHCDL